MINKRKFFDFIAQYSKIDVLNAFKYIIRDARISKYMSLFAK